MNKSLRIYLKILAVLYGLGAALHLLDVANIRLNFSEMNAIWRVWIIYLLIADTIAAVGLWRIKSWGVIAFVVIAVSQLIAYLFFVEIFGDQLPLIIFHLLSLAMLIVLYIFPRRLGSSFSLRK